MENKDVFIGYEVEGRLYGIKTLFIRSEEVDIVNCLIKHPDIKHVYICNTDKNTDWVTLDRLLNTGIIITLEVVYGEINVHDIPTHIFNRCHIQYCLPNIPDLEHLKRNDSIKIVSKPFTTYNFVKCQAQVSTSDDYLFDQSI